MLPSISNLLNDTRPTPSAPALHFIPPSPTPPTPPLVQNAFSPSSFPSPSFMPSPVESCASFMSPRLPPAFSMDEDELPPLQGYDPPTTPLRRVSSAGEPEAAPWSVQDTLLTIDPYPARQPAAKRRRGRPRSMSSTAAPPSHHHDTAPMQQEKATDNVNGNWTFLTPTTWNVPAIPQHQQSKARSSSISKSHTETQAPRKKRGRKPKTVLQGHSCFVLPSELQRKLQKP